MTKLPFWSRKYFCYNRFFEINLRWLLIDNYWQLVDYIKFALTNIRFSKYITNYIVIENKCWTPYNVKQNKSRINHFPDLKIIKKRKTKNISTSLSYRKIFIRVSRSPKRWTDIIKKDAFCMFHFSNWKETQETMFFWWRWNNVRRRSDTWLCPQASMF